MVEGREELAQSLERILTTNIEEWFLDMDFGLDYPGIWGKGKTPEVIRRKLTEALLKDERVDVVDIKGITVDVNRRLVVDGEVIDKEGEVIDLNSIKGVIEFD